MAMLSTPINLEDPLRHGEIQTNPPKAQRRIAYGRPELWDTPTATQALC